ncbi:MAG TPA: hypothetical protein VFA26_24890, partial [Gemmataceae bacterium]|nr:hypothetical protein [Gemmataceae bacterium]
MARVCRTCSRVNPDEALYCFHDGAVLNGHGQTGPIAVGARPFPTPFVFPSGRQCRSFDEMVLACDSEWAEARGLLKQGYLESFLAALGRTDLAQVARRAARAADPDRGLEQFLEEIPSDVRQPARLVVQPLEVNLGQLSRQGERKFLLIIENGGMGLLHGTIACERTPWLALGDGPGVSQRMFHCLHDGRLTVQVVPKALRAGSQPLEGRIVIETNGGSAVVQVRAEVPTKPFPEGILAGAMTPRQVAEKAKAAPREAATLFESGAVAEWYRSNGWIYPVRGPAASGVGAVQQFFEALGLTPPPRVDISERAVTLEVTAGAAVKHVLEVTSQEKRPVYAHATSNVPWLEVGRARLNGRV